MPKSSRTNFMPQLIPINNARAKPSQEILDLFKVQFKEVLLSEELNGVVQQIKKALYDRDYLQAFPENGLTNKYYLVRWTPSRSLAYAAVFNYFDPIYDLLTTRNSRVLSVGGGAAGELVGLAAVYARALESRKDMPELEITIVDISDWKLELLLIYLYVQENWLNGSGFKYQFAQQDILDMDIKQSLESTDLITLLFTTNELFLENKAKATALLQKFNRHCARGTYLLILESAGSYSHIQVGSKMFPIQFLVDTLLLGRNRTGGAWRLMDSEESCWYRNEKNLDYPMKLENMRFFYRLYQKI